jgi:methionyl-tRNA formyltransferase
VPLRIVFLGSSPFAIPCFEALIAAGHQVVGLITQPDREKGRGRELAPPPLKPVAESHGVPVLQPRRIREPEALAALRALAPAVQVVVAYGQILPRTVIDAAPLGTVNVHASLLPRYRGAAPVQWAIVRGERETGVTTMLIDEGLDTGPLLLSRSTSIGEEETAPQLEARLARIGAELLLQTLDGLRRGTLTPHPQDAGLATLAPLLKKEDGVVDWSATAEDIARQVRGFQPWPGTATTVQGRTLKILRARPDLPGPGAPGVVAGVDRDGIVVGCGGGTRLRLLAVQPESRRAMSAQDFAAGVRVTPGARFG